MRTGKNISQFTFISQKVLLDSPPLSPRESPCRTILIEDDDGEILAIKSRTTPLEFTCQDKHSTNSFNESDTNLLSEDSDEVLF